MVTHSSLALYRTVRFSGFLSNAYRLFFNPLVRSAPGRDGASARGRPRWRPSSVRAGRPGHVPPTDLIQGLGSPFVKGHENLPRGGRETCPVTVTGTAR